MSKKTLRNYCLCEAVCLFYLYFYFECKQSKYDIPLATFSHSTLRRLPEGLVP